MATAATTTQTVVNLTLTEDEFLLLRYLVGTNAGSVGEVSKVNSGLYDAIADLALPSSYRYVRNDEYGSVSINLNSCRFDG